MSVAALFLDRDGVVNVDKGYVHKPQDCEFVDGIFDLIARAHAAGMPVIIVTNQAGIARGYYSEEQFQVFTAWLMARFAEKGTPVAAVYHCPHHPTAGQGEYLLDCACRKPAPGMLLAARDAFNLDMAHSVMVGDMPSDMLAAAAAGVGERWQLIHAPTGAVPEAMAQEMSGGVTVTWRTVRSLNDVRIGA